MPLAFLFLFSFCVVIYGLVGVHGWDKKRGLDLHANEII
jgi:hypothetical protein